MTAQTIENGNGNGANWFARSMRSFSRQGSSTGVGNVPQWKHTLSASNRGHGNFKIDNVVVGIAIEYIPCSSSNVYFYHFRVPPFVSLSRPLRHDVEVFDVKRRKSVEPCEIPIRSAKKAKNCRLIAA